MCAVSASLDGRRFYLFPVHHASVTGPYATPDLSGVLGIGIRSSCVSSEYSYPINHLPHPFLCDVCMVCVWICTLMLTFVCMHACMYMCQQARSGHRSFFPAIY